MQTMNDIQNNFSFSNCCFCCSLADWNASAEGTTTARNFFIIYVIS